MLANKEISNCLAIAITYTLDWELSYSEFTEYVERLYPLDASCTSYVNDVGMIFSVITRLTSMLYGISFAQARYLHLMNIADFPPISVNSFCLVLVAFINTIVMEMEHAGRPIDKFILLIDDTAKVNGMVKELHPSSRDVWQIIRNTLLGQDITRYAHVSTALVLSTIDYSALHVTTACRPHTTIVLPDKLNRTRIVYDWWLPLLDRSGVSVSADQIPVLERFAAMCEKSPLAIELFGRALVTRLLLGGSLDAEAYNAILVAAIACIQAEYAGVSILPTGVYMHALLFNYAIEVDDEVLRLIQTGMFSNSIKRFTPYDRPEINPEASFILLAAAAECKLETVNMNPLAHTIADMYKRYVTGVVERDANETILRDIMKYTLMTKLRCDAAYPVYQFTFADLLHLADELYTYVGLAYQKQYNLNMLLPKGPETLEVLLPSYQDDKVAFYEVITDPHNVPTEERPYVFFNSPRSQHSDSHNSFDLIIAAYTGSVSPPLMLFLQLESGTDDMPAVDAPESVYEYRSESKATKPLQSLDSMSDQGRTYKATRKLLMEDPLPEGVPLTGLLTHIREGRVYHRKGQDDVVKDSWVYVYMSTSEKYTQPMAHHNCLLIGPASTQGFRPFPRHI